MENENKSQNILLNNTQNINNISNNNQNIIISTNGITSEQTKMIEYFVMFQKFMNFSPEMAKQSAIKQINDNNDLNNKEILNEEMKEKKEKKELEDNKDKGRRWNPIRRKSKNYEKSNININNEKQEQNNNLNNPNINTNYGERLKNKMNKEKSEEQNNNINENSNQLNNNYNNKTNNFVDDMEYNNKNIEIKKETKLINFDEIPIKVNNNILINNFIEEKPKVEINNTNIRLNNNIISYQNFDDIIIKPSKSNFIELVEQNLKNSNYKESKNKISNLSLKQIRDDKNIQSLEQNLKNQKIRLNKEKAIEIEKNNIHNKITNNIKKEKKNTSTKKSSLTIPISKSNNFDKKVKTTKNKDNSSNKLKQINNINWSKAKFNLLNENETKEIEKYKTNNPSKTQNDDTSNIKIC